MLKRFLEWIQLKEKLHENKKWPPPFVSEKDVWWVSLGENIGSEINGKSDLFSRPALILKKLSNNFFLVAPTTSQKKVGTWYTHIIHENKDMYIYLNQIRTLDYRRLSTRLGKIDSNDFNKVKKGFEKIIPITIFPTLWVGPRRMPNVVTYYQKD